MLSPDVNTNQILHNNWHIVEQLFLISQCVPITYLEYIHLYVDTGPLLIQTSSTWRSDVLPVPHQGDQWVLGFFRMVI